VLTNPERWATFCVASVCRVTSRCTRWAQIVLQGSRTVLNCGPGRGARMAKRRRWTVVFVPHGSEPSKIVEVSYGVMKLAAAGVALGVAAALLVGYATVARTADLTHTSRLQQENSRLAQEIGELHGRLSSLSDTLTQ